MDKKTLSHYGWLIIITLILAVMLALATPFGSYVGDATVSFVRGFFTAQDGALDEDNIGNKGDKFDSEFNKVQANEVKGNDCEHKNTVLQNVKEATCGNEGYSGDYYCNDCKQIAIYGKATPTTEHQNIEIQNAIKGSCNSKSFSGNKVCKDCNTVVEKGTYSKNNAHQPEYVGLGMVHTKCKICNMELNEEHEFVESIISEPTCSKLGKTKYTCNCGYSYEDPNIALVEHKATYGGTKDVHQKCVWCNKVMSNSHSYTTTITTVATCVKDGVKTNSCICGYSFTTTINKSGHTSVVMPAVAATCTSNGLTEGSKCSVCDLIIVAQTPIPATGHQNTITQGVVKATCYQTGYSGDTICLDCGEIIKYGEHILKTSEHKNTVLQGIIKGTCTTNGYSGDTICLDCGEIIAVGEITGGHNLIDVYYETNYVAEHNCTVCGIKIMPEGSIYYKNVQTTTQQIYGTTRGEDGRFIIENCLSYEDSQNIINNDMYEEVLYGDGKTTAFPTTTEGDLYIYKGYEYRYNTQKYMVAYYLNGYNSDMIKSAIWKPSQINGWSCSQYKNSRSCESVLSTINSHSVVNLDYAFYLYYGDIGTTSYIDTAPHIPSTITSIKGTFLNCNYLTNVNNFIIPAGIDNLIETFASCWSLTDASSLTIPNSVTDMTKTFYNCESLTKVPKIPIGVTYVGDTFYYCDNITHAILIPCHIIDDTLYNCNATTEKYHYTGCGH